MRRRSLSLLFLAAFLTTATGCRQTTGTIPGVPPPAGGLSPVSPSQQPILGPFGGNTRVTPPATGTYQSTGGYIGASTAPVASPSLGVSQQVTPIGNAPLGSGVQVAGWSETNSVVPTATQPNAVLPNAAVPSTGANQTQASGPRSGGMHVNDLTGAPAPPGYRAPGGQTYGAPSSYVAQPQSVLNAIPSTPNSVAIPQQQTWQQPNVAFQSNQNQISPTIARAPNPATTGAPAVSQIPATTPTSGPSTEPIPSAAEAGNLMWRRPGSQF